MALRLFGLCVLLAAVACVSGHSLKSKTGSNVSSQELLVAIGGERIVDNEKGGRSVRSSTLFHKQLNKPYKSRASHGEPGATSTVEKISLTDNQHINSNGSSAAWPLSEFGSTIVNGSTVYIVGGFDNNLPTAQTCGNFSSYNILTDTWTTGLPPLPINVAENSLVELNGTLYALGGFNNDSHAQVVRDVYTYELAAGTNGQWQKLDGATPNKKSLLTCAVVVKNAIYINTFGVEYVSKDGARSWQKLSLINNPKILPFTCVAIGSDAIMSIGSFLSGNGNEVKLFNVTTNTWQNLASLQVPRESAGAVVLPGTRNIIACGGTGVISKDDAVASCEKYDSDNNTWTLTDFSMNEKRASFGLYFVSQ